jgi:hypothetical protein
MQFAAISASPRLATACLMSLTKALFKRLAPPLHAYGNQQPDSGRGNMLKRSWAQKLLVGIISASLGAIITVPVAHAAPKKAQPAMTARPGVAIVGQPVTGPEGVVILGKLDSKISSGEFQRYCGGAIIWQSYDIVGFEETYTDYILSAYQCIAEDIKIEPGECQAWPDLGTASYVIDYRQDGRPNRAISKVCRQPEGNGYGKDVILLTTKGSNNDSTPAKDIYSLGRFNLSPKDVPSITGKAYGYAQGTDQTSAPGDLEYTELQMASMGYALDAYDGNALEMKASNKGYLLKGDIGGPLIINESLVGVISGSEVLSDRSQPQHSFFSRVDPDWVQEKVESVMITEPKPGTYLTKTLNDKSITFTVKGKAKPASVLLVQLRVGEKTDPYLCNNIPNISVSKEGTWSCEANIPGPLADPSAPIKIEAIALNGTEHIAGDAIYVQPPADSQVAITRPSPTSGNYGQNTRNPDGTYPITLPSYNFAGLGIYEGFEKNPLTFIKTTAQESETAACGLSQLVEIDQFHAWTCALPIANDGKRHELTVVQQNPFQQRFETAQAAYIANGQKPVEPQILNPSPNSDVYPWTRVEVRGDSKKDSDVELSASSLDILNGPSSFNNAAHSTWKWVQFSEISAGAATRLARVQQFQNGQPSDKSPSMYRQNVSYRFKDIPFTIDSPQPPAQLVYPTGKDIPVSGRASPGTHIRVDQVDEAGNPVAGGYSCDSDAVASGAWQCSSPFTNTKNSDLYWLKAQLTLPGTQGNPVGVVTRQFEIGAAPAIDSIVGNALFPAGDSAGAAQQVVVQEGFVNLTGTGTPNARLRINTGNLGGGVAVGASNDLCTSEVTVTPQGTWNCNVLASETGDYNAVVKEYIDGRYFAQTSRPYTVVDTVGPDDPNPQDPVNGEQLSPPPAGQSGIYMHGNAKPGAGRTITLTSPARPGFSPIKNIPINPKTGNWTSPLIPYLPGDKYQIQVQLAEKGNPIGKIRVVDFYMAPEIAGNAPQTLNWKQASTSIQGRALKGSTVTVRRGGTVICSVPSVPASGNWACGAYPVDAIGKYILTVTQTGAGMPEMSSAINVDVVPPLPSITSPASESTVKTATYTIEGVGVPGALIKIDGIPQQNGYGTVVNTNGKWTSPAYVALPGDYEVTATQYVDGHPSQPATVAYKVEVKTPTITSPPNEAWVSSALLTVKGTAQPFSTVKLADTYGNPAIYRTVQADGNGNWSVTYITSGGAHLLRAQEYIMGQAIGRPAEIYYGGMGASNVAITTPGNGQIITNMVYTVGGTGQSGAVVQVSGAGLETRLVPVDESGNWSTQYVGQAMGSATATAKQILNGTPTSGDSTASVSYLLNIHAVPNPVSIASPAENAVVDEAHSISGQGVPGAIVSLEQGEDNELCTVKVAMDGTWSCGTYTLIPGSYTVTATQLLDTEAGLQQAGPPLVRHYKVRKPPAPITIDRPTEGEVVKSRIYTVSGKAQPGASVTIKGLGLPDHEHIAVQGDGSWSTSYVAKRGKYTILAMQYLDGKALDDGALRSYTVDANVRPLHITSPEENQVIDVLPYSIQGTGDPGATVVVTNPDHSAQPCRTQIQGDGRWTCGPYDSESGSYWVQARQYADSSATTALGDPLTLHYRVRKEPPPTPVKPVTIVNPEEYLIVDGAVIVSGTAQPGTTITLTSSVQDALTNIPVNDDGTWSTTYNPLKSGGVAITATQYLAGEPVGKSPPRAFTVGRLVTITRPLVGEIVEFPYIVEGTGRPGTTVVVNGATDRMVVNPPSTGVQRDGTWSVVIGLGGIENPTIQAVEAGESGRDTQSLPRSVRTGPLPHVVITYPEVNAVGIANIYTNKFKVKGTSGPRATIRVALESGQNSSLPIMYMPPVLSDGKGAWETDYITIPKLWFEQAYGCGTDCAVALVRTEEYIGDVLMDETWFNLHVHCQACTDAAERSLKEPERTPAANPSSDKTRPNKGNKTDKSKTPPAKNPESSEKNVAPRPKAPSYPDNGRTRP